jgi:phosphoribosyl 1,2-cyclic phosphodiesterase
MKRAEGNIKITFWGVRGSIPTPGRKFRKYGGNTLCVEVRCDDTILIFDAGTGIRELGRSLNSEYGNTPIDLNLLISHTHWDHIQGFPFFEPAYMKKNSLSIYGGHSVSTLENLFIGQMNREYFPVTLSELAADIKFIELNDNPFYINNVNIYFTYLLHPVLSLGFRVEYLDKVFVYATDNEILLDPDMEDYNKKNYQRLVQDADVLVAECQYTEKEYFNRVGWGHAAIEKVVKLSNEFGVKNLYAFHHDFNHTDRDITRMIKRANKIAEKPLRVYGAREKTSVFL